MNVNNDLPECSSKPGLPLQGSATVKHVQRQIQNVGLFSNKYLDHCGSLLLPRRVKAWIVAATFIFSITLSASPSAVSAISIAAVNIGSSAGVPSPGGGFVGGSNAGKQQSNNPQPPRPSKLTFQSGKHEGNGSSFGTVNFGLGSLSFGNKTQPFSSHSEERTGNLENTQIRDKLAIKVVDKSRAGETRSNLVKRNVGDTRITSHQDVTTLALAVDNSSSVAISNINSQFNNVYVTIGSNQIPNRFGFQDEEGEDDDMVM